MLLFTCIIIDPNIAAAGNEILQYSGKSVAFGYKIATVINLIVHKDGTYL
ncbi:MAG: hypothetical protein QNK29_15500 [Desulfobacterales bacterium]|nr:hypothetical protein [Desulfobacterales bacterium]